MTHVCTACGRGMTEGEWDDRHWPHDAGCPRRDCQCNNEVHEACCWECRRVSARMMEVID